MKKKYIAIAASVAVAVIGFFCFRAVSVQADDTNIPEIIYTQNQNWGHTIYQLEDGNYYYQTLAKTRTSTSCHLTIALEVSRIKDGINPLSSPYSSNTEQCSANDPHFYRYTGSTDIYNAYNGYERDSFLIYRFNTKQVQEEDYHLSNGYTLSTWKISYDAIWDNVNANAEWAAEIQAHIDDGTSYYFGIDNVKTYCTGVPLGDIPDKDKYENYAHGSLENKSTKEYFGTVFTWANWNNTSYAGMWSNLISDFYNHYYAWQPVTEPEQAPSSLTPNGIFTLTKNANDLSNTSEGKSNISAWEAGDTYSSPGIYTYNEDSTFDVGVAIPTTERYTNHVEEDAWYGSTKIAEYTYSYTHTFNYQINYSYTVSGASVSDSYSGQNGYMGMVIVPDNDLVGMTVYYIYENNYTVSSTAGPYQVSSTWSGDYYTVTGINLYQLNNSYTVNNSTEPETTTYYDAANVSYDITINGINVTTGQQYIGSLAPDESKHVAFHSDKLDSSMIVIEVEASDETSALAAAGNKPQEIADARVKNNAALVTLTNDKFTINGATYLDDSGCHYFTFQTRGTYEMTEADGTLAGGTQSNVITDAKSVYIPKEKENGKYYTDITAVYQRFINSIQTKTLTVSDIADSTKNAIPTAWKDNEPVVVHSPVIAPISIEGEKTTQLTNTSLQEDGLTELQLDGTYTLNFDQIQYFTYKGYDVYERLAGYLKYVDKKALKFPFSVRIGNIYYEPQEDGYTEWITFPGSIDSVTIYIPSWAVEGVYGVNGYHGYDAINRPIKVKCSANNYQSYMEDFAQEYEYDSDLNNYEATFDYPVQISGVLYNFQVVSVHDATNWATQYWTDQHGYNIYDFVSESGESGYRESEKKVGIFNRLGTSFLRYTIDGYQTASWSSANTLPLASGSSGYDSTGGYLVRGNAIAFTFKTIANLAGEDSYIKITPTYRYIDMDGNVYESDEIKLYYDTDGDYYVRYGSDRDEKYAHDFRMYAISELYYYEDSLCNYYYNTKQDTADLTGMTLNELTHKVTEDSYNLSSITLSSALRLLTGNEEELAVNMQSENTADTVERYKNSSNPDISNVYGDLTDDEYTAFKSSMQTWYGFYRIPSSLKVCFASADPEGQDYLDGTEDFWLTEGYLVLNFEIETYRDGDNEHLTYYSTTNASNTNMWHLEQFGTEGGEEESRNVQFPATYVESIEMRDGDVGIITLDALSVAEHYSIGKLYMN